MCVKPFIAIKKNDSIIDFKKLKYVSKSFYDVQKSKNLVEIPCGKCNECLKNKRIEIVNRLEKELKISKIGYFLTLTYDDENKKDLNKRDMQLFLKKYRKYFKIRYFYVGELGEKTKRPHYHAIIFKHIPNDLIEYKGTSKHGYKQYDSEFIKKLWGKGLIKISKLTKALIAYITKYILKNSDKKEFICEWSRKPPIGINPETIKEDVYSLKRTKAEKRYYKKRYGDIPKLEIEEERNNIKIDQIEKQTKLKYIDYINKKV